MNIAQMYAEQYAKDVLRNKPVSFSMMEKLPPLQVLMYLADDFEDKGFNPQIKAWSVWAKWYESFKFEVETQFIFLQNKGFIFERQVHDQGYITANDMCDDVLFNKRLIYFPTDEGFGTGEVKDHPMLEKSTVTGLCYNDMFRCVHDVFGHCVTREPFDPLGEINAYFHHRQLFFESQIRALTSETLMQTCWVEYGRHLRDDTFKASGNFKGVYAEQKLYSPNNTTLGLIDLIPKLSSYAV